MDKDSIFFKRQSKRSYLDKEIPEDALQRIYEKVRWSPSCNNNQPWRFVFVKSQGQREKVCDALARGNQWMKLAPVIAVVCAKESDDFTREDDNVQYHQFDCGLATMSLLLAATEEGLLSHPTAGWSSPKIKEALNIPDEFNVMCVIGLGYHGPLELLDERAREYDQSERVRKELSEVICEDSFKF